jgi:hypothetical protein
MGEARKAALQHAKRLLDQAHARTLGVVYNKIAEQAGEGHYFYRRGYYLDEGQAHGNGKSVSTNGNGHGHARAALRPADVEEHHYLDEEEAPRKSRRREER